MVGENERGILGHLWCRRRRCRVLVDGGVRQKLIRENRTVTPTDVGADVGASRNFVLVIVPLMDPGTPYSLNSSSATLAPTRIQTNDGVSCS